MQSLINLRPLLAREALIDDLGVAVDAQVVDGSGIARGGSGVATTSWCIVAQHASATS